MLVCAEEEMSLSHCSSKPNHKLSKSSQPVPATGIIVLWFAHLFSIVHLGSPSMTYKTINSKGFVPDREQIYFRYRYSRKQVWVGEKIPIFPVRLWLLLHLVVDSFALSCPANIQTMIIVALSGSVLLMCRVDSTVFCHTVSGYYSYRWLMATAKARHKSIIISIDFFVEMDLSVTERSVQANVQTCAFTNDTPYHNMLS